MSVSGLPSTAGTVACTNTSLYSQAADNTGAIARLTTAGSTQVPMAISPDATSLLLVETDPKTGQDIKLTDLPRPAPEKPQTLIQSPFNETNPDISPDGRWVAYESNESGVRQVYVRPFPKVDAGHWQISTDNGLKPVWSRNGRELFCMTNIQSGSTAMMAVAVQTGGALFSAGNPVKLFDLAPYYLVNNARSYDVSADGRFLLIKNAATNTTTTSLVVVEHWTQELEQRVPAK